MQIRKMVCPFLWALLLANSAFTQQANTAPTDFLGFFEQHYRAAFTKPFNNYFQVLTKALGNSFNFTDNRSRNAMSALVNRGLTERQAVDSMFGMAMRDMLGRYIWQPAEEVYNKAEKLMQHHNRFFCPCINEQLKGKNRMDKLAEAVTACNGKLLKDSAYLQGYEQNRGSLSLKEIYEYKDYFYVYMYQHCPTVLNINNETLLNIAARDEYVSALTKQKRQLGQDIVRYLQKQKLDSLALVFPDYKKHNAALQKVRLLLKNKAVKATVYFSMPTDRPFETIRIGFDTIDKGMGELRLTTHNRLLKNTVTAAKYTPPPKDNEVIKEDQIIEITGDNN